MPDPWPTKNPFMSKGLGSANRVTGSLRARATAPGKGQRNAAMTEVTCEILKIFTDAANPAAMHTKTRC